MKAIALFSGGLDSTLAVKVMQQQGIEVVVLHFVTPFGSSANEEELRPWLDKNEKQMGVQIKPIFLKDEFLAILANPRFGHGKNINPCIDCKILMLKKAKSMMQELGAGFLITGEVMGQRPMSQRREALDVIENVAGVRGLLLRPLCAKHLRPTIPETEGWVDRNRLLGFWGRGRNQQFKLAQELGVVDYAQPSGGCALTEKSFSDRVQELIRHKELNYDNCRLLKVGRHFRLTPEFKLVVGKDEKSNIKVKAMVKPGDLYFEPKELAGPSALGRGVWDEEVKSLACRIIARYTDSSDGFAEIVARQDDKQEIIRAEILDKEKVKGFLV